jgi:hypothetical protein
MSLRADNLFWVAKSSQFWCTFHRTRTNGYLITSEINMHLDPKAPQIWPHCDISSLIGFTQKSEN